MEGVALEQERVLILYSSIRQAISAAGTSGLRNSSRTSGEWPGHTWPAFDSLFRPPSLWDLEKLSTCSVNGMDHKSMPIKHTA